MSEAKVPARSPLRYELKAIVESAALSEVRMWLRLHDTCFAARFPTRRVNSLYFDSQGLDTFEDSLAGMSQRHKVRLRWYGTSLENVQGFFEVKVRDNRIGWKLSQKIEQPLALERLAFADLLDVLHDELAFELREYLFYEREPVLLVGYQREYYETFDGRVRITVDHHLEAFDQRQRGRLTMHYPLPASAAAIVECKGTQQNGEALAAVLASAPFRITRSSKYTDTVAELLTW